MSYARDRSDTLKASSYSLITGSLEINAEEIKFQFEIRTAREKPVTANLSASLKNDEQRWYRGKTRFRPQGTGNVYFFKG